jgi:hypothetical protein
VETHGERTRRYVVEAEGSGNVTITARQARFISWTSNVLLAIVVLNFFVEYVHTVVIDSFLISVLTAILLTVMVEAVKSLEHKIVAYFRAKPGTAYKVLGAVIVFSILFFSKFLILEVVNFVFGDHVELGHFIEIVALILTMLATEALMRAIYDRLGAKG